jgi:hypothetical protein
MLELRVIGFQIVKSCNEYVTFKHYFGPLLKGQIYQDSQPWSGTPKRGMTEIGYWCFRFVKSGVESKLS